MDIILASHPAAPSSILGVSEFVQIGCCQYFFDSALIKGWTVQILIVDRNHLVLVSDKLVLQKRQAGIVLKRSRYLED